MAKKLAGKVAVVTGASKGIGAAIAKQLAAEGAAVVVNYASSKVGAEKVAAEIEKQGGKAVVVQADVARREDIERLAEQGFFVAKRGVEAGAIDSHGFGHVSQACALVTLAPENLQGTVQRPVGIEGAGPPKAPGFSHSFHGLPS